ncbi:sugar ABC transporter ATP-binding protein [Candidatus Latescibacterota bacterium]
MTDKKSIAHANTIITMCGIKKAFGGVHALKGVNLEVVKGEVHALIGENGAGKSTLMKILSGALKADEGEMILNDNPYSPQNPMDARMSGISMVYQELNLAEHLTIEENLTLGIENTKWGFIQRETNISRINDVLRTLKHPDLRPQTKIQNLSPAARQLVEIARGLITDNMVFVLDEPTSSLSHTDMEQLFEVIRTLKKSGVSIIYISHFLEEVKQVADRFTVLRDGKTVGTGEVRETPIEKIIELMVGRTLTEMFPRIPHDIGDEVFRIREIKGKKLPFSVSVSVKRGEILGIAGLVGAGRTETFRVLYGLDELDFGEITIGMHMDISGNIRPYRMINHGIAFLSEDRKTEGLAVNRSIAENITLSSLPRLSTWSIVHDKTIERITSEWVNRLSIKIDRVTDRIDSLSGGNQQKVALARLLQEDADIYLLDEPTRGVDVGSKVEIFRLIGELASQGKAIIIVSSYFPELLGVCDTIAVMHRGILGQKKPSSEWDEYSIMNEATSGV